MDDDELCNWKPDTNVMKPYNPKLKSATQRFTNF